MGVKKTGERNENRLSKNENSGHKMRKKPKKCWFLV